jgi:hypothetical protein
LRLLIGQDIGLPYLIPLALKVLVDNPLVEGDLYEADLMLSVLRVPASFWASDMRSKRALKTILASLRARFHIEANIRKNRNMLRAIADFEAA